MELQSAGLGFTLFLLLAPHSERHENDDDGDASETYGRACPGELVAPDQSFHTKYERHGHDAQNNERKHGLPVHLQLPPEYAYAHIVGTLILTHLPSP